MAFFFGSIMFFTGVFLILLVLVQKGRGGGLTGALGGMGGESAFGSKAGDAFTKITFGTAVFWILFCMLAIKVLNVAPNKLPGVDDSPSMGAPLDPTEEDGTDE